MHLDIGGVFLQKLHIAFVNYGHSSVWNFKGRVFQLLIFFRKMFTVQSNLNQTLINLDEKISLSLLSQNLIREGVHFVIYPLKRSEMHQI